MSAGMVHADYCPECGSPEIVDSPAVGSIEQAYCAECGWSGYRDELVTAQDLADEAGEREYDRLHDEADEWPIYDGYLAARKET